MILLDQIAQTIDAMAAQYGEIITWRTASNCLSIDMPLALVAEVNSNNGVKYDIALQTITGLLVPQLGRIPPCIMQTALGSAYTGKRGDYIMLVANACNELKG